MFLFRRDLRLADNTGLQYALQSSKSVAACFILDPRQTGAHAYRSEFGAQFLRESLEDLAGALRAAGGELHVFQGRAEDVVSALLQKERIDAVFMNRDYTPFSRLRDAAIAEACKRHGVACHVSGDALLHEPEDVCKNDGKPYTVFTPFYNKASALRLRGTRRFQGGSFLRLASVRAELSVLPEPSSALVPRGGRANAVSVLKGLASHDGYSATRDVPANEAGTTLLSAHLKFGTCSVREAYEAVCVRLGDSHPLLRQFYWRDFFTHVAFHFPHVFGGAFHRRYDALAWSKDEKAFLRWCSGETGFPIVDAGMRQLRATGFMHNRVRMITASFLVKDLHIDWKKGERHFATLLTDYDPCVNNGNWQWAASTGCDAVPYFRVFNPWLQQKKFDPQCVYVKRWVPELRDVPVADVHAWYKAHVRHGTCTYPSPIVDHAKSASVAKAMYRAAS